MHFNRSVRWLAAPVVAFLSLISIVPLIPTVGRAAIAAQSDLNRFPPQMKFTEDGNPRNMMDHLGIKTLSPGTNPNDQSTLQWKARQANSPLASKPPQLKITPEKTSAIYAPVEKHGQLGAGTAPTADQPTPRTDSNSQIAHAQLLEKARKGGIDVYFEGDSITRRWGTSDEQYKAFLANWRQNFFGWNAANFGWGGDTTQNILWRLKNGELDHVNPKIIVVMAGTNNVGNRSPEGSKDPRVADITRGIKAILDVCRQKAPNATIVLMGITPRNDNLAVMPIINQINDNIARFADGKKIKYLNINNRLADKDGKLFEGMANPDGLHLDVKGYQVWADALKPIFTELLGPPAKEDHAPPPTGDPSTRKIPATSRQSKVRI